jgi:hypothetical protein
MSGPSHIGSKSVRACVVSSSAIIASDASAPDEVPRVRKHPGEESIMEIFERIRYARDQALDAERTERERLAEADNADLQQAASVRLATRQAVREALDDILDEESDPS